MKDNRKIWIWVAVIVIVILAVWGISAATKTKQLLKTRFRNRHLRLSRKIPESRPKHRTARHRPIRKLQPSRNWKARNKNNLNLYRIKKRPAMPGLSASDRP